MDWTKETFKSCLDLARTPYFRVDESGRLAIKKEEIGEIIDFHTHLGFSFGIAPKLNLRVKTEKIDYFFPYDHPFTLDVYSAVCFSKEAAKKTQQECTRSAYSAKGFMRTHTVPNILGDMDRNNVSRAVLHAIDMPAGLSHNTAAFLQAAAHNKRLTVFGSVHPYAGDKEKKIKRMISLGAQGMKLHPANQLFKANNKKAYEIYELCQKYRLPMLFHTGHSDISPKMQEDFPNVKYFKEPIKDFPNAIFIMGHSGIHQYAEAIELGKKHENVYLEISGQPPQCIKEMIDGMGSDRILFGSDWPFYAIELPLTKALIATEGAPEIRRKILSENAKRLMRDIRGVEAGF